MPEYIEKMRKAEAEEKKAAKEEKAAEPGFKNCWREANAANDRGGVWEGPPSLDDCMAFAKAVKKASEDKTNDILDEMAKGIMKGK
jgi:hypothetical protein